MEGLPDVQAFTAWWLADAVMLGFAGLIWATATMLEHRRAA